MSASREQSRRQDKPRPSFLSGVSSIELLSSEEYEDPEIHHAHNELSDVEEKSFFESEPEEPNRNDIKDFLGKIEQLGIVDRQTPPFRSNRSQRLEDQQIIVVEQENEMTSNCGNESVILEHIEFNTIEQMRDSTPDWEREEQGHRDQEEDRYIINCIGIRQPPWVAPDHENASYSSPCDFQNSEIRPIRNSKNTCVDRQEVFDLQNQMKETNKSCIAKPMGGNDSSQMSLRAGAETTGSEKNQNFRQILNKWNDEIYPRLEEEYKDDRIAPRRSCAEYQMEKDSKLCISKYNLGSECHKSQGEKEHFLPQYSSSKVQSTHSKEQNKFAANLTKKTTIASCEMAIQTNMTGFHVESIEKEIEEIKNKLHRSEQENNRLKQKWKTEDTELGKSRDALQNKQKQYDHLKNSYRELQLLTDQDRKWSDQSRRLQNKNRELEKLLLQQSEILKRFEEKTEQLEKKMQRSYNEEDSPRSPAFADENKRKIISNNQHEQCNKLIEELQEYIFDIEQKIAGFDIQVEKKVRVIEEQIEQEARRRSNEDHRVIVNNLKDEIVRLKQNLKLQEDEKTESAQKVIQKQKEIKARQTQVNRMYEELVTEWKQIEKQKEKSKWKSSIPTNSTPIATKAMISPKSRALEQLPIERSSEGRSRMAQIGSPNHDSYYFSNKQLGSPIIKREKLSNTGIQSMEGNNSFQYLHPDSSFFRNERKTETKIAELGTSQIHRHHHLINEENKWGKREIPKISEPRENNELVAINNKIQKLRKEINRQLEAIH